MKLKVSVKDMKDFENGSYFDENIFGVYMKLLHVFSQIFHELYDFNRKANPKQPSL